MSEAHQRGRGDAMEGPTAETMTPDEALDRLVAGKKRYAASKQKYPNQTRDRRAELSERQHPFALILGCADSRVPSELIFDQWLGDLFVVRVAGTIADDSVLDSIEYAAAHLHSPLIMVLVTPHAALSHP